MLHGRENIDPSSMYNYDISLIVAEEYFNKLYNGSDMSSIEDYHLVNLEKNYIVPTYIYESLSVVKDIKVKEYKSKQINDYHLNRYILHFKSKQKNHSMLVKEVIDIYINTFKLGKLPKIVPHNKIDSTFIDECYPDTLELSYDFLISCIESYRMHELVTKEFALISKPLSIYSEVGMYIVDRFHRNSTKKSS